MESLNLPSILTPDFGLLFWMLIAFVALFIILGKFALPAILGMVEERKQFIDESLQNARAANEKLATIQAEGEKILQSARSQQAEILKEAMATRDAIIKEAKEKATIEGSKLLEEAKNQILVEKANALQDIRSQVADLSIQIAEKVLRQQLDKATNHDAFVNSMLDDISNK